jgi:nuclear-control-of-ATPase protein 2
MLELDQILRANELSISLVAAVPGLLLSWTLLRGLWVLLLVRAPPDARREATPCR